MKLQPTKKTMENMDEKGVEGGVAATTSENVGGDLGGEVAPTGVAEGLVSSGGANAGNGEVDAEKSKTLEDLDELNKAAGEKEPSELIDDSDLEKIEPKGEDPGPGIDPSVEEQTIPYPNFKAKLKQIAPNGSTRVEDEAFSMRFQPADGKFFKIHQEFGLGMLTKETMMQFEEGKNYRVVFVPED